MRRRLILVSVAVASLIVIAFSVPLGLVVRQLASDRALSGAERDAQLIAVFATATGGDPDAIVSIVGDGRINGNDLTVILADGTVLGAPLVEGEDLSPIREGTAGRRRLPGGEAVYTPAIDAAGNQSVVRVLVADDALRQGVRGAWLVLGGLGVLLVALAAFLADRLARSIVRPVERLSDAAGKLGAGDLSIRVETVGPPEIADVAVEFNRLAEQVARLLETERETAADLSHRLRTPLAAFELDLERLETGPDRERLLEDLAELRRVVDFVIREMRRAGRSEAVEVTDLATVVLDRTGFWSALAEEQARKATIHVDDQPVGVSASAGDLEAAVDALLGNVFSHTPEGTRYAVECALEDDAARLVVDDAGPGWGDATIQRGISGAGSTGLGLDIARRTAEATGGSLSMGASPLGGARVVLRFGKVGVVARNR